MKLQPMLQVDDVIASSAWFQDLLGLHSGHGGPDFEMLFDGKPYESQLMLLLHRWDAKEHGDFGLPDAPRGNGCSLWFELEDRAAVDAAWSRADREAAILPPHWNALGHQWEFQVKDPNGYVVAVHSPSEFSG